MIDRRRFLRWFGLGAVAAAVVPPAPIAGVLKPMAGSLNVAPIVQPRALFVGQFAADFDTAAVRFAASTRIYDAARAAWDKSWAKYGPEYERAFAAPAEEVRTTFATIREALDAAKPGDTIRVAPAHVEHFSNVDGAGPEPIGAAFDLHGAEVEARPLMGVDEVVDAGATIPIWSEQQHAKRAAEQRFFDAWSKPRGL